MARVLVVDDDSVMRILISRAMSAAGYVAVVAADGDAALAAIQSDPPDLVLLDRMMPGISGDDVLRAIRDNPATANLPVIMLTALRETEHVVTGFSAGATDYLAKPFDLHELRARVASRIGDYTEQRAIQSQIDRLQHEAATDPLTSLANRRGLEKHLAGNSNGAVLLIDVDGLKRVNDEYGHATGDAFLREVADRLKAAADGAFVARIGGDEFAVHATDPAVTGESLRRAVADRPFAIGEHAIPLTVSIGFAMITPGEDVLADADRALYLAKTAGKNRVVGPG